MTFPLSLAHLAGPVFGVSSSYTTEVVLWPFTGPCRLFLNRTDTFEALIGVGEDAARCCVPLNLEDGTGSGDLVWDGRENVGPE